MFKFQIQIATVVALCWLTIGAFSFADDSKRFRLHIIADIDGSDRLIINEKQVRWEHRFYKWPNQVSLNGIIWHPEQAQVMHDAIRKKLFPKSIDHFSASVIAVKGRDVAVMRRDKGTLVIYFADTPPDRATYEMTIEFDYANPQGESGSGEAP